jgi:uncharacterized membrane protein
LTRLPIKKAKQAVEKYKTEQQKQQQFESRQQEIVEEANRIQQRQMDPPSDEIVTANGKIIILPRISDDPPQQSTIVDHKESDFGIGGIFIGIIGIMVLIVAWRGISWLFGLFGC